MDLPFYSGEIVSAKVVELRRAAAILSIRGQFVTMDVAEMDWNALRSPDELLSIGDRLEVVVHVPNSDDLAMWGLDARATDTLAGVWASRLPLLEDPWPGLRKKYPDGAVVEVEMVDYLNWYMARVRMPEGLVVKLRTRDFHPRMAKTTRFERTLRPGERFQVVFRKIDPPGGWVERFIGGSVVECLAEAGYLSSQRAALKLTELEQDFIRHRAGEAL